jgi:hypothetical protein
MSRVHGLTGPDSEGRLMTIIHEIYIYTKSIYVSEKTCPPRRHPFHDSSYGHQTTPMTVLYSAD